MENNHFAENIEMYELTYFPKIQGFHIFIGFYPLHSSLNKKFSSIVNLIKGQSIIINSLYEIEKLYGFGQSTKIAQIFKQH